MAWNIHIANVEDQLQGHADQIKATILATLERTNKVLPIQPLDILVMVSPYGVIPELGIGGYCSTGKLIQLMFQPENENFSKSLGHPLERIITHELHHAQRFALRGREKTLGDAIVMEGLACHFVRQIYGSPAEPWEEALSKEMLSDIALLAHHKWNDSEYNYREWFFGSDEFPRWAGYSLGYALVGKYLELNPQETAATLVSASAERFKSTLSRLTET